MKQYQDLVRDILNNGEINTKERTGVGTIGVFQRELRHDLNEGTPFLTTKKVYQHIVIGELLWFLNGGRNIRPLLEDKVRIWTSDALRFNLDKVLDSGLMTDSEVKAAQKDAKEKQIYGPANELKKRFEGKILEDEDFAEMAGDLGPVYGVQWRGRTPSQPIDQLAVLEEALDKKAYNRRLLVDAWTPEDIPSMALPPCHYNWQANISPETGKLTIAWNQRSCDVKLGIPYNFASYGVLGELLAHTHGYEKGELVGKLEDVHIYRPHKPAAEEQLERTPTELPRLQILTKRKSVADYKVSDFKVIGNKAKPLKNPTPMFGGFF